MLVAIGNQPHLLKHSTLPRPGPAATIRNTGQHKANQCVCAVHRIWGAVSTVQFNDVVQFLEDTAVDGDLYFSLLLRSSLLETQS